MKYSVAEKKNRIRFGEDGDALLMLIYINVLMFIILSFIRIVYVLSDLDLSNFDREILHWFTLPASLPEFITKPWVLITHMFTQDSVWQLIGNMFFFWAFGYLFQDLVGNKHVAPLYIYGALVGAVLFVASANLLPHFAPSVSLFHFSGAGAAIMAIAIATTILAPDYRVFPMINGGIPLWVITLIYVIIDFAGLASESFPFHLSHMGGAVTGLLYVKLIRNGREPGVWMHQAYNWFFNLFNPAAKKTKGAVRKEMFYKTEGKQPFKKTPNLTQQRVDEILDKISQKGYQSLTQEEKDILKKASES
ncbi:MAG: rhomboid family intramembrane serine protease [Chitinophagaceae bacterium]